MWDFQCQNGKRVPGTEGGVGHPRAGGSHTEYCESCLSQLREQRPEKSEASCCVNASWLITDGRWRHLPLFLVRPCGCLAPPLYYLVHIPPSTFGRNPSADTPVWFLVSVADGGWGRVVTGQKSTPVAGQ